MTDLDAKPVTGPATGTGPHEAAPGRLFTVGIPVFNGRSLLRNCLQSVVASSFPHDRYEIVVADDGSTEPETLAILAEVAAAHEGEPGFFRVLSLGANSGGAARPRNRILDEALGEYVFFVDSDDTIGSLALERIAEVLTTTPADWVALHQVLVNGRVGAASVRQPRMDVTRMKALTTLTVHKVFRRAEVERQGLRFDEGLPSGQDVSFAFAYILNASRFVMLGGYDYYYLTRHAGNPNEPAHLSRRASTPAAQIEKNHRILASMLADLRASSLPEAERLEILGAIALPRVLVQQRYLTSIVALGPDAGPAALRRLAQLLNDPMVGALGPAELTKTVTAEHLRVVADADWGGLRDLVQAEAPPRSAPPPKAPPGFAERWARRGRRVADVAAGWAAHRQVVDELAALRRSVEELQQAQRRLEAEVRAVREQAAPVTDRADGAGGPASWAAASAGGV